MPLLTGTHVIAQPHFPFPVSFFLLNKTFIDKKENYSVLSGPRPSPSHHLNHTSIASKYESPMWQLHDYYAECNGTYLHPMFGDKVNDSLDLPARNKQSKVNLLYQLLQALLITIPWKTSNINTGHLLMKHTFKRELIILAQPNSRTQPSVHT